MAQPVEVAKQTIYQGQLVMPVRYPTSSMPYGYGSRFYQSQATSPSQPYITHFDPVEVERAIYKDVPTEIKKKPSATGTEPQKMIKLRSGLEVPQYIIRRDVIRKKNEEIAAKSPPPVEVLPLFYKLGVFASEKPAQASVMAVVLGVIAGNIYFNMRKDQ